MTRGATAPLVFSAPQWLIRIKYPIKSIGYMLLILLDILHLFDFIDIFNHNNPELDYFYRTTDRDVLPSSCNTDSFRQLPDQIAKDRQQETRLNASALLQTVTPLWSNLTKRG